VDFAIRYLIEIDFLNAYICGRGREHGVSTPVNDAVCDMVREIEDGKRQMSLSNVKDSVFERIKAKGKR
jgi:ketopantoate reductase